MKRPVFCLCLSLFLFAFYTRSNAAIDIYMVVAGITGESQNTTYKGSIEIITAGQANSVCAPTYPSTKGTACAPVIGDFSVQMALSSASEPLLKALLKGTLISTIDIYYVKQTGATTPLNYYTIHLTNVTVTQLSEVSSGDDQTQQMSLSATTVLWTYRPIDQNGILGTAVTTSFNRNTQVVN